jgi:hypothetical protein
MEEIEVPVEQAQEHMAHEAAHTRASWVMQVALSSAIFAVFAAIAALLAGHASNEAVVAEIRASQQWNLFQMKGIKADIADTKRETLAALGHPIPEEDHERKEKLAKDKEKAADQAREQEAERDHFFAVHNILSPAVTFFQVTIAIGAVAVLTKRRRFWLVSLVSGVVGLGFLGSGLFQLFH